MADPKPEKTTAEINAERKLAAEAKDAALKAASKIANWSAGSGSFTAADLKALKAFAVGGE